jgi:peroxiredoxin family protein
MRGLTLIAATGDSERLRAALTIAAAHAALGGRTRLYCHERAVALLAGGDPGTASLLSTALEIGVHVIACQTGLSLAGLAQADLPPDVETGGLVGLLADLGDDRLDTV